MSARTSSWHPSSAGDERRSLSLGRQALDQGERLGRDRGTGRRLSDRGEQDAAVDPDRERQLVEAGAGRVLDLDRGGARARGLAERRVEVGRLQEAPEDLDEVALTSAPVGRVRLASLVLEARRESLHAAALVRARRRLELGGRSVGTRQGPRVAADGGVGVLPTGRSALAAGAGPPRLAGRGGLDHVAGLGVLVLRVEEHREVLDGLVVADADRQRGAQVLGRRLEPPGGAIEPALEVLEVPVDEGVA